MDIIEAWINIVGDETVLQCCVEFLNIVLFFCFQGGVDAMTKEDYMTALSDERCDVTYISVRVLVVGTITVVKSRRNDHYDVVAGGCVCSLGAQGMEFAPW